MAHELSSIALTMLRPQLTPMQIMQIYRSVGNCDDLVQNRNNLDNVLGDVSPRLKTLLSSIDSVMPQAEKEMEFCEKHSIQILTPDNPLYPQRLNECEDAPLVLYYRGNADLNSQRVINIIGTRHITAYGQDIVRNFVRELHDICPDVLIVSGLAYGVDIHAHRNSLDNGMLTVGVLAHGLDTIYPATHRDTAKMMVSHGGLLTEFPSSTRPEKRNFVQRNRIVAGMSDACILVESARKGGGLITAGMSMDYNRDVFAFPGCVGAPYSEGCNNIIRDNVAHLITSANDFVQLMQWENAATLENARREGIERQLFPDLTSDEQVIVDALEKYGDEQVNLLAMHTNLPINTLSSALFTLEMKGVVRPMAGGTYHLLK